MLTIIATGLLAFGIGLWIGEAKAVIGCRKRMDILKDILIEKGMEEFYKDQKLVDEFVDRIKKA